MRNLTLAAVLVAIFAGAAGLYAAPITNGGFETAWAPWGRLGDTFRETVTFGVTPPEGTYQALLTTSYDNGAVDAATIESFLGIPSGTLQTVASPDPSSATYGSAIRQLTVTGNAGDILHFSWDFLTNEYPDEPEANDYAFWSLPGELTGDAQLLADLYSSSFSSSSSAYDYETQYQTVSYILTTSGTWTLGFGVVNEGDDAVDSALLVDHVWLEAGQGPAIPEPASLTLCALGILGLVRRGRRQGR
jgi:hypothetical protein